MEYIPTRFLYIKDEVELSLVTALLKKRNLQECYYWTFELYYSGFDIFQLLWKIYFDFYYELNPLMEEYIIKKHSLWKCNNEKKIIHIASIVRNLFRLNPSPNTFILRQYMSHDIYCTHVYKSNEKTLKRLSEHPLNFHRLLLSINNGHTANICYYIKLLIESSESINTIRQIIMNYIKPDLLHFWSVNEISVNDKKWSTKTYKNDLHYLLAFICHLQSPISILNKCNIFVTPKQVDIEFINKVESEPIPLIRKRGFDIEQTYNTLRFKRYFNISNKIGSFKLARWSLWNDANDANDAFLRHNWFHWEYYATNGYPLWQERLKNCGGSLDHEKKVIIFPNDDDDINKDRFYNLYAYEFDEQPNEIQMMSHCDLKKRTWHEWYFDVFPEQTSVLLNDDFYFIK